MITIHDAIRALNQSVITIRGDVAYNDKDEIVEYSLEEAQSKLIEMQDAEKAAEKAQIEAKDSAILKLSALGLTADEIKALVGA
jgi:hypothetical protein